MLDIPQTTARHIFAQIFVLDTVLALAVAIVSCLAVVLALMHSEPNT